MANLLTKPLSDSEVVQRLRDHNIYMTPQKFSAVYLIPDRVIRTRNEIDAILLEIDHQVLPTDYIDDQIKLKRLPITVSEYFNACSENGVSQTDASRHWFFMKFLKKYDRKKQLKQQSTIQVRITELE